ncbi:HTH domain-containing protein [bacterium]|nr:HTH domain-containing protein [bacterium]
MIPQNKEKNIKKSEEKRRLKRAALIKLHLTKNQVKQTDIAKELKITTSAVYRAIFGLSKIAKVDEYLKTKFGV